MPDRFMSGQETIKFDAKVSAEIIDEMETLEHTFKEHQASFNNYVNEHRLIHEQEEERTKAIILDLQRKINGELMNIRQNTAMGLYPILFLLDKILRNPIFRFLNFFCKWFRIDKETKHIFIIKIPYQYSDIFDLTGTLEDIRELQKQLYGN